MFVQNKMTTTDLNCVLISPYLFILNSRKVKQINSTYMCHCSSKANQNHEQKFEKGRRDKAEWKSEGSANTLVCR